MSSDGSRTTNSSRFSQFGLYRTIDARTEEFLRLSRKRQIRQGCACAAVSTVITVTVVVIVLLVYEYTINTDTGRGHKLKKTQWHDILNDSSVFETKNKPKINLDPSTLKLLPMILKALSHNLYYDNSLDNITPTVPPDKNDFETTEDTNFPRKNKLTNWLQPHNALEHKSHYKSSNNLDYYSKIRNVRNYQKVLNLFDKMMNNKMSGSRELGIDEPDKIISPNLIETSTSSSSGALKQDKVTTEDANPIAITTESTIIVTQVFAASAPVKVVNTPAPVLPKTPTKHAHCACSKRLRQLMDKILTSIHETLPEINMVMDQPCFKSNHTLNITSTTIRNNTKSSEDKEEVSSDNPLQIRLYTSTAKFTSSTETPTTHKYFNTTIYYYPLVKKTRKRLELEPNKYLKLPTLRKIVVEPKPLNNKENSKPMENDQYKLTENFKGHPLKFTTDPNVRPFLVPTETVPKHVSTVTTSMKTRPKIIFLTTIKRKQSRRFFKVTSTDHYQTSSETNHELTNFRELKTKSDLFKTTTPALALNNNAPMDLKEFNLNVLELIKSKLLRATEQKELVTKEPNTYLDQILEQSYNDQISETEYIKHLDPNVNHAFTTQPLDLQLESSNKNTKSAIAGLKTTETEENIWAKHIAADDKSNIRNLEIALHNTADDDIEIKFIKKKFGNIPLDKIERPGVESVTQSYVAKKIYNIDRNRKSKPTSTSPTTDSPKTTTSLSLSRKPFPLNDDADIMFPVDSKPTRKPANPTTFNPVRTISPSEYDILVFPTTTELRLINIPRTTSSLDNDILIFPTTTKSRYTIIPTTTSSWINVLTNARKTVKVAQDNTKNENSAEFDQHKTTAYPKVRENQLRKSGILKLGKGFDPKTLLNMAKRFSRDRKTSALLKNKGDIKVNETESTSNYLKWLDNVGHPINVGVLFKTTTRKATELPWFLRVQTTTENSKKLNIAHTTRKPKPKNSNSQKGELPIMKTENVTRKTIKITPARSTTTWGYDVFNDELMKISNDDYDILGKATLKTDLEPSNNDYENVYGKARPKSGLELPDSEILLPVQEVPIVRYLEDKTVLDKRSDSSGQDFWQSIIVPHSRPSYLEIVREDWNKDIIDSREKDSGERYYV